MKKLGQTTSKVWICHPVWLAWSQVCRHILRGLRGAICLTQWLVCFLASGVCSPADRALDRKESCALSKARARPFSGAEYVETRSCRQACVCVLGLLLYGGVGSVWGQDVTYTVSGTVEYRLQVPQASAVPLTNHFTIAVSNCTWRMYVRLGNRTPKSPLGFGYRYDGTDLLWYIVTESGRTNLEGAVVQSVPVPEFDSSDGGPFVWLAYASHCYLVGRTNHVLLSLRSVSTRAGEQLRFEVPATWRLREAPPRLPEFVRYWATGVPMAMEDKSVHFVPFPPPFTNGYPRGEFRTHGIVHIGDLSLPERFEYREFRPTARSVSGGELECVLVIEGRATKVEPDCDVVLPLPDALMIEDRRVSGAVVEYPATPGAVPSTTSEIVRKAQERSKRLETRFRHPPYPLLHAWRWIVVAIIVGPAAYAISRYGRNKTTGSQTDSEKQKR